MGLFNFVKEAGEKLWDTLTSQDDAATKVQDHLKKLGIPDSDKVQIKVEGNSASVYGDNLSQEAKEKILVAVGNVSGINSVNDHINVTASAASAIPQAGTTAEPNFYQVQSGDTLSAISKKVYGDANKYQQIFEANKPMLSHPDKIYPGQTLRIPTL